ncbi:MAG: hypothetical protein ABUL58_04190 [Steroidobacter sp.]
MQQDQDVSGTASSNAITLCRKSWVAYFATFIRALLITALFAAVLYWKSSLWKPVTLIWAVAMILILYRWLLIRSFHLYYDDIGVWLYSGALPWRRGVIGVKWRDLDEATFVNGFSSWLSGSYTVIVRHRFTKDSEILVTQMANGKQAATTINQQLQERIRKGISLET